MSELVVNNRSLPSIPEVCQMLAECVDINDVLQVRASYAAIEAVIKSSKIYGDAREVMAEGKLRTERRAGELLAEMEKQRPGEYQRSHDGSVAPSLKELGINHNQSSRWQKLASIPERSFEKWVAKQKENEKELTAASAHRFASTLVTKPKPEPKPFEIMQAVREVRDKIESLAESWPDDCKRTLGEFLVSVGEEYIEKYGGDDV